MFEDSVSVAMLKKAIIDRATVDLNSSAYTAV